MFDAPNAYAKPATHLEYIVEIEKPNAAKVKEKAFEYMDQLEGWCSKEKAAVLIDIVLKTKPQTIVEIGVFGGKSLVPMAYALKVNGTGQIFGIDPWDSLASIQGTMDESNKSWWGSLDHEAIQIGLVNKINAFKLQNQIELIKSTSEDAPLIYDIDILHVDGNHSDETSYLDVIKWVPLMNSGGWIIFDDMSWQEEGISTTSRAVEWLNANCIKFAEFSDICLWGIWLKP